MMYTVGIQVRRERAEEWEGWMRQRHIPNVMRTGCFAHAYLTRDESSDTSERLGYRTLYLATDEESFATYQSDHAALLQQEHLELFAGDFEAKRETFNVIARFDGSP